MKEELKRNQSASTCENNGRYKKHLIRNGMRVKIKESQTLQQDLSEHIRKIMRFSLADQFNSQLPKENVQTYTDQCFLNPKKIELSPGLSRIKQHFIQQYQEQFVVEGIQEIHNHKHAVQSILYAGLSASALASAKWNSIQAMRRMRAERPLCPDFKEYPLDKETEKEIEQTKAKINRKRRAASEHEQIEQKLALDRSHSLNKYLDNLVQSNKTYTEIYGQRKGEYDLILDYAKKERIDMRQADDDIQFIKSRQTPKINPYRSNVEIRRMQRRKYVDDDDVFPVRPNKVAPTRVILNQNHQSNI